MAFCSKNRSSNQQTTLLLRKITPSNLARVRYQLNVIRKHARLMCIEKKLRRSTKKRVATLELLRFSPTEHFECEDDIIPQKYWDELYESAYVALEMCSDEMLGSLDWT